MKNPKRTPLQPGSAECAGLHAAIYCRKSTETEGRSKSRDQQLELCQLDAERFEFRSVTIYFEEEGQKGDWYWKDSAGRNPGPHRPELTRLVNDIESGKIGVVLVYKHDRFVRDAGVGDALAKVFRNHGVYYLCGGRDTEIDSARGLYQISIESAAARQLRDLASEDIRRDHYYKARQGMFSRNPSCFGFRSKGRGSQQVEPIWNEIHTVRRIFQMFVHGEGDLGPQSLNQIARHLMREGIVLSVGAKGHRARNPKKVTEQQVRNILTNCMYVARWRHNGEEYDCPRLLVTEDGESRTVLPIALYEAAQAKLALRTRRATKVNSSKRLLNGVVVCAVCGRPMHVNVKKLSDGKKQERYFCPHRTGLAKTCSGDGYSTMFVAEIESWVTKHLAKVLIAELQSLMTNSSSQDAKERESLEKQIERARSKETDELSKLIGVIDSEQLAAIASRLRQERKALESRLTEVKARIGSSAGPEIDLTDLLSTKSSLLSVALRRAVKWIAVSSKGLIVLTAANTYIGAVIEERGAIRQLQKANHRMALPPGALATQQCRTWIPNPTLFVAGRRESLGEAYRYLVDEELLPPNQWENESSK